MRETVTREPNLVTTGPASGNAVKMRTIDIWRVKDGLFVEHWDELNLLEVFQQVGVLPPLGVGPATQQ